MNGLRGRDILAWLVLGALFAGLIVNFASSGEGWWLDHSLSYLAR